MFDNCCRLVPDRGLTAREGERRRVRARADRAGRSTRRREDEREVGRRGGRVWTHHAGGFTRVHLSHHALGHFPRLERVIQTEAADVTVRADALDAREVLDLGHLDALAALRHRVSFACRRSARATLEKGARSWKSRLDSRFPVSTTFSSRTGTGTLRRCSKERRDVVCPRAVTSRARGSAGGVGSPSCARWRTRRVSSSPRTRRRRWTRRRARIACSDIPPTPSVARTSPRVPPHPRRVHRAGASSRRTRSSTPPTRPSRMSTRRRPPS